MSTPTPGAPGPLRAGPLTAGSSAPPAEIYDVALLDLDGVVYVGPDAVPGVPDALSGARAAGMRLGFVTNNAARTPEEVAAHLTELGVPAASDDVITSSQAAATVVADLLGPGANVLPVGGPGVAAALTAAGLTVVGSAEEEPAAVVQGYGREVGWAQLAEAVVAVRNGARHVATNADATIPSPRGPLPGNGAMVGVVRGVTGRQPLITGKPDPAMHAECVRRTGARRPLVVGDRLDTDIEGARRAGADSLLVLTGVTDPGVLLAAGPQHRPDLLSQDAAGLLQAHPAVTTDGSQWSCGRWTARAGEGHDVLVLEAADGGDGDGLDGLRALCVAHWSRHPDSAAPARILGVGAPAEEALARWDLASASDRAA
ncbi:HAD-IIA family hydrolase [Blastococcus haudaquaticus]|uniref:Haloacid Dehalogenase Superfamily Class (Subfamily) IIA/haloacid dehalogenase superfamily, subfamily IA, variant 1 with third motif having Dx(3-4)D or Dx(3-4)E n=1 Tax=Blastococcus haudaquaticus TaxID=1938745 RepID=A0A286GPV3_9ACTN|nr:HAD-IIA family hydrolase [Blastococcus haudaquaticus]SOD97216.1 Haloacid Dehalogenase Superfamily Class (subfamily) IIA/haloacid dehalogenase superfamily, subfamily IA, variant 1 with third motif having Dx(3-4)D or Dx(3-4)E [Blastococcus haudaquaticus]